MLAKPENELECDDGLSEFWEGIRNDPQGLTSLQIQFARQRLLDPNASAKICAERAGSRAQGKSLANVASNLNRNEKVKALLAMAETKRDGGLPPIGDAEEAKRLLWKIARQPSGGQVQIRALEVIGKLIIDERQQQQQQDSPEEICKVLAGMGPIGRKLARDLGVENELSQLMASKANGTKQV